MQDYADKQYLRPQPEPRDESVWWWLVGVGGFMTFVMLICTVGEYVFNKGA